MKADDSKMIFRCDGSFETGLGHLARCAVIARNMPEAESKFVISADPLAEHFLSSRKIDFQALPAGTSNPEEARLVAEIAQGSGANGVVLDIKDNSPAYLEVLKRAGLLVVDIEDRSEGRLLADILIDSHLPPDSGQITPGGPAFCGFGPDWVMLDPVYARLRLGRRREKKSEKPGTAFQVVVSCGGSDPAGLTPRVLEVLASRLEKLRITVVLGAGTKEKPLSCGTHPLRVVRGAAGLEKILDNCDLAVVSGGITKWECLCLGLPTVFVPQHEEQAANAGHAAEKGGLLLAHPPREADFTPRLESLIDRLLTDEQARRELSRAGSRLVDGLGLARLRQVMASVRVHSL